MPQKQRPYKRNNIPQVLANPESSDPPPEKTICWKSSNLITNFPFYKKQWIW